MKRLLLLFQACQTSTPSLKKYALTTPQGLSTLISREDHGLIQETYLEKKLSLHLKDSSKYLLLNQEKFLIKDNIFMKNNQKKSLFYEGFFFSELKFALKSLLKHNKIFIVFEDPSLFENLKDNISLATLHLKEKRKNMTLIELEINQEVLLLKYHEQLLIGLYWPSQNFSLEYVY